MTEAFASRLPPSIRDWVPPWTPGLPLARCTGHVFPADESPWRPADVPWPRVPARSIEEWTLGPLVPVMTMDAEGRCRSCSEKAKRQRGPAHRDVREREAERARELEPPPALFDDSEPEAEPLSMDFRMEPRR